MIIEKGLGATRKLPRKDKEMKMIGKLDGFGCEVEQWAYRGISFKIVVREINHPKWTHIYEPMTDGNCYFGSHMMVNKNSRIKVETQIKRQLDHMINSMDTPWS